MSALRHICMCLQFTFARPVLDFEWYYIEKCWHTFSLVRCVTSSRDAAIVT